jgi:LPXTG-motif cell wall-anchored protein
MLRPRPLATVIASLALLAGVLVFAPIGSPQSGIPTLSPTPPVPLPPPPTAPTTTTAPARPQLPKTGLEVSLVALTGIGLLGAGTVLRRTRVARPPPRRRRR